jgi:type III restriction enzyme
MSSENNFFRFNNLKNHIVGIKSIDELINQYLPLYEIKYSYSEGKDIYQLEAHEKLQLLVGVILPEVRKAIDRHMPKVTGSHIFRPKSLSSIFQQEKNIYLVSYPAGNENGEKTSIAPDERAQAQSSHDNPDLQFDVEAADWYAYSENYGTSEEKRFVKFIATQIDELKSHYKGAEIYLIRNELDYWLFSPKDGRRFSPDYMLIINDAQNGEMYYQCLIEPKGGHLLEKDEWKEDVLISLDAESQIIFDTEQDDSQNYVEFLNEVKSHGYKEVKCLGFKFYNTDPRDESDFAIDFRTRMPS